MLTAVGGGTASVLAASQGVSSQRLTLVVIAPCCQVGDGAPASVQQSFQDALARNQVSAQIPVSAPAARVGSGYVQMVQSSSPEAPVVFLLAKADQAGTAYLVAGAMLARYQALGGPGGDLGYPLSDASGGGTQLFAGGALAGNPVRVVSGVHSDQMGRIGIRKRRGRPACLRRVCILHVRRQFRLVPVVQQRCDLRCNGWPAGRSSLSGRRVDSRPLRRLGGAAGDFGMPVSDEFASGALRQQNFEGGNLTYATGDSAAVEHPAPKLPGVVVAPSSISAGGRSRLAVLGFPNNSTIRVSVTGRPDFLVNSANGSYTWEIAAPLDARSATLTIHAVDTQGTATADGTLTIKGFTENRVLISKLQGDNQTGVPGRSCPCRPARRGARSGGRSGGRALPVQFQPSPGAQVTVPTRSPTVRDAPRRFSVCRPAEGIAAVTVDAPSIAQAPATFYARSSGARAFPISRN